MACVALEVVLDVALVGVDVAALPVAVGPLGEEVGEAGEAQKRAQPRGRGRVGQEVQREHALGRARRDLDRGREVELDAGAVRLDPHGVAGARDRPGRGRAVTHGHAADGEQVGRAVRAGVAAVGAEAHPAPGLVEILAVAGAESDEPLVVALRPARTVAQRPAPGLKGEYEPVALERRPELEGTPPVERAAQRERAVAVALDDVDGRDGLRLLEPLRGDHALRSLHEAVLRLALGRPQRQLGQQRAAATVYRQSEGIERDRRPQLAANELDLARFDRRLQAHPRMFAAGAAILLLSGERRLRKRCWKPISSRSRHSSLTAR